MDTATLVVAILFIAAASLASYFVSQWNELRGRAVNLGWMTAIVGTTLLLAAAAIFILAMGFVPTLRLALLSAPDKKVVAADSPFSSAQGVANVERESRAQAPKGTAAIRGDGPVVPRDRVGTTERDLEARIQVASGSPLTAASSITSTTTTGVATTADVSRFLPSGNPWAATSCVIALNRDPSELERWTLENECGVPVAILIASCSRESGNCEHGRSPSWDYRQGLMLLPGKAQRYVTVDEETRYGTLIRYVACSLTSDLTIGLIGQSGDSRTSSEWQDRFEQAVNGDECMSLVRHWVVRGQSSGLSPDYVLGPSLPGAIHGSLRR
jgi:hypothetical protein